MHLISSDAIYSAAHLTGKTGIKNINDQGSCVSVSSGSLQCSWYKNLGLVFLGFFKLSG